jgi:cell division septum initiation protein DivIVA/DNA-binding XRE family transcriptional regulator
MTEEEIEAGNDPVTALDATALRHARHEANLTQAQLAERIGVRVLAVEQWEWGTRPVPRELVPAILAAVDTGAGPSAAVEEAERPPTPTVAEQTDPAPYDPTVVESLFEQVSATTARLQSDVAAFIEQIEELDVTVEESDRRSARFLDAMSRRRHETLLRDTLLTAQKAAHDVREDARRTATAALRKARRRAQRILDEAARERARAAEEADAVHRAAEKALAEAKRARDTIDEEIERLTRAAREEAERMLREAEGERQRMKDEIRELEHRAERHREEMRGFLRSMLGRLDPGDQPHPAEMLFKDEMARRRAERRPDGA